MTDARDPLASHDSLASLMIDPGARETTMRSLVTAGVEALCAEMAQGKSEALVRYLDFASRFYHYSAHNQFLIAAQCPEATFVAGYKTWQTLGYAVRKGERGIRIWAPQRFTRKDTLTDDKIEDGVRFVPVAVFDASQMAGIAERPLPLFFRPLGDDGSLLADRLTDVIRADGIRVIEQGSTGQGEGYSAHGVIVLKAGLAGTNRFLTLLHEYGHELLHWDEQGKALPTPIKECEAEALSYIVAHALGVENPFSSDYLQHWGATGKDLLVGLERIQRAVAHVLARLEMSSYELRRGGQRHR